jgi:hydrogenase maturation factor
VTPACDDPFHCVTCSDEGIEMRVVAVDEQRALALCAAPDGARTSVEVALVGAVAPGDALLVHAGTALTRLEGGVT